MRLETIFRSEPGRRRLVSHAREVVERGPGYVILVYGIIMIGLPASIVGHWGVGEDLVRIGYNPVISFLSIALFGGAVIGFLLWRWVRVFGPEG